MTKKIKKPISNIQEIQNSVKTLLANIRFASVDYPLQSIAITSAVPNEGKTTTIIELAKAIAASGNTVLLVEADMRRRAAASALGVHPTSGAYSVMVGNVGLIFFTQAFGHNTGNCRTQCQKDGLIDRDDIPCDGNT